MTLSSEKAHNSFATEKAANSEALHAEVMPTKKIVLRVSFLKEQEAKGSKGPTGKLLQH